MKNCIDRSGASLRIAACTALSFLAASQATFGAASLLSRHVPAAVTGLTALKHLDNTNRLHLAIGLPLRDKPGLTNLLQQLYDPASPNYHHWLTTAEFTSRFGPTEADYTAVKNFAHTHNLAVVGSHPNRMIVDVSGTVPDIEAALHTSLQVYQHPTESRQFYAPSTEPSPDLSVPVLHISGLDNYRIPKPTIAKKAGGASTNQTPGLGSGPGGTYMGNDFRAAYAPGVGLTGTGQTVALLEFFSGFFQSDVTAYETLNGIPNIPVTPILIDGYDGSGGIAPDEVALDIDMALAIAPGLSRILVYEGEDTDDLLNRIANDNQARQVSASWFYPIDPTSDQIYQQYALQGQSFFNSSGDGDAYVGTVGAPADDPYIIVVGGTTLSTTGPNGTWTSEKVWNWGFQPPGGNPTTNGYTGGGGGISATVPLPTWQLGINMVTNHGSTTFRNLPDVSLTADNIFVIYENGLSGSFGGTSAASPLWAGYCALINQQATANGFASQGFLNPAFYAIGKSNIYTQAFHDTILGDNSWPGSGGNYAAVPGFDLATGWGTPTGSPLINALVPVALTPVLSITTNFVTGGNGNGIIDQDECNNLTFVLTNSSSVAATGVSATLISTTPGAIVAQSTALYPSIFGHASAGNLTPFTLSTPPDFICGTPINLILVVKSDQGTVSNTITLPSGVIGSPDIFSSSPNLPIPNTNFVPVNSPIVVSGLQSVGNMTVSVYLPALADAGISITLISPSGTNVVLSQNNGGFLANYGVGCSPGAMTTFDDSAPVSILNGTPPYVGSFQPEQPLSVFHLLSGPNLNGVWNLQVSDEFPGDTATLACWSLNISPEVCIDGGGQCPGADLSLTMSAVPNPVFVNSNLVYNLTVSNAGPSAADNVVVVQSLPTGVGFVMTSNYPVSVSQAGSNLDLSFGSIPVYGSATVSVITIPVIPGQITSTASVGSAQSDPNPLNNAASATVIASAPAADVGVTMFGSPSNVLQGGILTYTINVTNNGPSLASNVTLLNTLTSNANFISATTTQGTISNNGTFVSLGNLGRGTNAVVIIKIAPTITGNITATTVATISGSQIDPIAFNNTASVQTTIGPAADLSLTGFATPSPVVAGTKLTNIFTIVNNGPTAASSVQFIQSIAAGETFISSTLTGYTLSNNTITATVASSLANGQSVGITNVFQTPTLLFGAQSNLLISTVSISAQPGDPNTNNNSLTLQTLEEPPVVTIISAGASVTSGSTTGSVGPTGNYGVQLSLQNIGTIPTTNLVATLLNSNGVTLSSGSQTFGALAPGGAAKSANYTFVANSTNGGSIVAILQLQDGTNTYPNVSFTFVMPVVQTFRNTNFVSIPAQQFVPQPDNGPAGPYPSTLTITNVGSNVAAVTVTLSNLFHTYPNDIGMLLISPSGASCVLMASAAEFSSMTAPANLTFDQSAPTVLSDFGQIVSGTYRPADYFKSQNSTTETFTNSPIPSGPYNTNLSVFNATQANGTWSLYVEDNAAGDSGAISNGWSLAITTITPVNQVADLSAAITASSNQVQLGDLVTYKWTVSNNGPNSITAYVTNVLSSGLTFVTNQMAPGATSTFNGSANIINLGTLAPGATTSVTNTVRGNAIGTYTNAISAGSLAIDPNLVNNSASMVTTIAPPPVSLGLTNISVTPTSVVIGNNVVYTFWVANSGPSNAFNVVGSFTNSSNFKIANVSMSQGFYTNATHNYTDTSYVQFYLNTIPVNTAAQVVLTTTPLSVGSMTNTFTVSTICSNLNAASNTITQNVNVTYPIPVIAAGPVSLISQTPAPLNGAINSTQTNTVSFTLLNTGAGSTTNLWATLVSTAGIRPITLSNSYGAIPAGGSGVQTFAFVATGSSGSLVTAQFNLKDGSNTNLGPVSFTFAIPTKISFTNSGVISIPFQGAASPYPSIIQVSGLTNGSNSLLISKATATLHGFAHSFPHDVEAMLVSPTGQELMLMEHTGGYYGVSNLTLTFDDAATQSLSLTNSLTNGTFLATANSPFDILPGLSPAPTNSTNLAVFNGLNPNGIWSLYVYDDSQGNNGVIANGWSLDLTAVSTVNPAARLAVSTLESPNPGVAGDYLNYQVTVNNAGPGDANSVYLTNTLPAGLTLAAAPDFSPSGSYSTSGSKVTCNFGTISNGASASVTFKVLATYKGTVTNSAVVTTASTDLYPAGTTNVITTTVIGIPTTIAASLNGSVLQLVVNGTLGQGFVIQSSTNLRTWLPVTTNTGSFTFFDNASGRQKFYRVVQVSQ